MNFECLFLLAFALLGASAAPFLPTAPVGVNNINGVGATVSETVVTPYHRSDAVSTPCGRSVVHTTALPVVSYGLTRGTDFLGAATALYPGVVAGGLVGAGLGAYPGVVTGGVLYPGIVSGGLTGPAAGVYQGVGAVSGAGIVTGGLGVYPAAGVVV